MVDRSVVILFDNKTKFHLVIDEKWMYIYHGRWSKNLKPPKNIKSYSQAWWGSESNGFMTGTEGYVRYSIMDGESETGDVSNNWVQIRWENPYYGFNSYPSTISNNDLYSITRNPNTGSGNEATVIITFSMINPD
ncbi:hypothetical protein [Xenorhabdus innexi]|uniref:Putative Crystal protein ET79 n=1 Tax=Xenorhabdus innexi TaxID=290109 RepID=A0A1N6MYV3_9GAMM|nr:hypothetical protein [Xenorhabdus innexi]PHM31231.1 hypothetical protein Xinn_02940 [Xenorhabdus innexi]SIP74025.1 putative Crystal protein ET79 [Xenorhabdus innexi]